MTDGEERSKEEKDRIIGIMYDNRQNWVRHYNGVVVQINSLAIGGSAAVLSYFISTRWSGNPPPREFAVLLVVPMVISGFALWSTQVVVKEMQSIFQNMIQIEKYWKMYEKGSLIPNESIFEDRYQLSDRQPPAIPKHLMIVQTVVLAITLFVAGLSLAR